MMADGEDAHADEEGDRLADRRTDDIELSRMGRYKDNADDGSAASHESGFSNDDGIEPTVAAGGGLTEITLQTIEMDIDYVRKLRRRRRIAVSLAVGLVIVGTAAVVFRDYFINPPGGDGSNGGGGGNAHTGTVPAMPGVGATGAKPTVSLADGVQYDVLDTLPHDSSSFTQGLTYNPNEGNEGMLYESTGLYGQSKIRKLDPQTGEVLQSEKMDKSLFGEGMAFYNDGDTEHLHGKLIQITWKAKRGFIYDAGTLEELSRFKFTTTLNEGWGITYDPTDGIIEGGTFIVSDGSEYLHFWSPQNPGVDARKKVKVIRQNGQPAKELNELEFADGKVIANVWYADVILVTDPLTGECTKEYDFGELWPKGERKRAGADVLNGISVSGEEGVLYVTGKKWDRIYKVKLH